MWNHIFTPTREDDDVTFTLHYIDMSTGERKVEHREVSASELGPTIAGDARIPLNIIFQRDGKHVATYGVAAVTLD